MINVRAGQSVAAAKYYQRWYVGSHIWQYTCIFSKPRAARFRPAS